VVSRACPLFVPLVEEGWVDHPVARAVAAIYLRPFLKKGIDVLVLGCTHYPLMTAALKKTVGRIRLIDSAEETAKAVRARLERDGLLADGRRGRTEFFSSDDPAKFARLGRLFLHRSLGTVRRLTLESR
jgi:glutamate racemase